MSEDKDKALVVEFMTKHHLPLRFTDYATAARNRDMASDLLSLLATVRRDTFKSAAGIATMMSAGETYETGRQKALNIAAALERAADSREGGDDADISGS